ncbi:hypothetical protein BASA50_003965 [Batrachochytrium salamandrivorans]|uniref:Uncharacterized protein n=1 Tax=Batrachochytrium salamandrivorans TaxID=1357716 RepID=A0ABQ8FGU4_9FUNG|nr:hypothetical protein BASA62_005923 [Batrachochytrium salamandrivorans]KAH6598083.1 hypothetical protein BASA50_003965 [Batrachochytrium salamandrivorans]
MKLIFFVAISFLAITVSAQAPQKYFYKSLRLSDQAEVEVELSRLREAYEEEEARFSPIEKGFKIRRHNAWVLKKRAELIVVRLKQTAAGSDARLILKEKYNAVKAQSDSLHAEYSEHYPSYVSAREKYDNAKAALGLLKYNQKQITDYNAEYGSQIGPSPKSLYNIGFLDEQNDSMPKEIDALLEELEGINVDDVPPNDGLVVRSDELKDKIRLLRIQCKLAKEILWAYECSQSTGARFMKSLYSRLPNAQIK